MTSGQKRRQDFDEKMELRTMDELDTTYAHLRAVVENCKRQNDPEAIRHQLVGLLPECRELDPERAQALRDTGHGDLVDLHNAKVAESWAEYGYGAAGQDGE